MEGQARAASSAREPDVTFTADADPAAPPVQQAHADLPACDAPEAHADAKVHRVPYSANLLRLTSHMSMRCDVMRSGYQNLPGTSASKDMRLRDGASRSLSTFRCACLHATGAVAGVPTSGGEHEAEAEAAPEVRHWKGFMLFAGNLCSSHGHTTRCHTSSACLLVSTTKCSVSSASPHCAGVPFAPRLSISIASFRISTKGGACKPCSAWPPCQSQFAAVTGGLLPGSA